VDTHMHGTYIDINIYGRTGVWVPVVFVFGMETILVTTTPILLWGALGLAEAENIDVQ